MPIKIIDPFTNIELMETAEKDESGDAVFMSNLRSVNIGDGGNNVFRADKSGIWLGAKTFASAPFKVSMAGAITAGSITITGGTIRYGKTSFTDNTHDGYYLGSEGIYFGKASDTTLLKFTISDGSLSVKGAITAAAGSNIAAGYISGTITASQIGSVNASAITGTITASQIGSVNASAITGYISASQITSITAGQITGSITAGQITSLTAGQITGQITASQIADLTITAGKIANLTITASQIANLTITNSQISASAGITAGKLSVTSLSAITASCGSLKVGGSSNTYGTLSVRDGSDNEIALLNNNAIIVRENKAFSAESSTAGVYTQFYTSGLNGIIEITSNTSGTFGIKDDDSSDYLMKWSNYDIGTWKTILPMVAGIDLGSSTYKFDDVFCATLKGLYGEIYLDQSGRIQVTNHLDPSGAGSYNLGGSVRYWNDVSYKTLTDRGCLGWFDEGVELIDGRIVSDIEAIKNIQKHPTKKTIYGKPMLDYKTLPKVCYKPAADHNGKILERDQDDNPYIMEKGKKIMAQDGAEMTSMFSIMIGSLKELDIRLAKLENSKKD